MFESARPYAHPGRIVLIVTHGSNPDLAWKDFLLRAVSGSSAASYSLVFRLISQWNRTHRSGSSRIGQF